MHDIDNDAFIEINNHEEELKNYRAYFKNAAKQDKKRITLRINSKDLNTIRKKASEQVLPYQTLINILLRHYVRGKIEITL
ncbi:hypothetical protein KC726_00860 [Candidatus Woesebacteria bacterium]|nr:hypothetical protein [Candidatus Woesebacteria bacterium]